MSLDDAFSFLSDAILQSHQEKLLRLIDAGWEAFYREMFGDEFVDGFDSLETADVYHSEAVEWHWDARLALLTGQRPPDNYWVYFPTWPRGFGKTTLLRRMLLVDAMLTYAYGQRGYALIPGGTKAKIRSSAISMERMLHDPKIQEWCPELAKVETNTYGRSRGWTADFISTQAGYVFHFIGLDEGVAGANVDNVRPTIIAPDDIDSREDSPVIAETRFRVLTSEILPTRQANTLVFWAQNLISRYSVRYRVESEQDRILTNRKKCDRIPAVRGLLTEQRTVNGIVKDIVVAGNVTWRKWNLARIQDEIDTYGLEAFRREMQHEVESSKEGLILHNYNDQVHVISESEFAAVYGSKDAWLTWRKKPTNDWARTKTDKHANVAMWWATSSQESALPNFLFLMHPMSFPAESAPEDVAERLLSCLDPYAYTEASGKKITWAELRIDLLKRINADSHTTTVAEKMAYEHGELSKIVPRYAKPLLYRCNVQQGDMSHEASTPRRIYASVYSLGFKPVNPKKHGGIELINRDMQVDYESPHPFRPHQMGFSRWFMVVPDDKNSPYVNDRGDTVYLPKAFPLAVQTKDLHDDDLCRFQFANWRYREPQLTASGETIDDPLKLFDDFCFVANTQVLTSTGNKNIQDVRPGEWVLTREGWQEVEQSGETGIRPTVRLTLSDGTCLEGTANHPIWVEGEGWKDLGTLTKGNAVQMSYTNPVWQRNHPSQKKRSSSTAFPSPDTPTPNNGLTAITSPRISGQRSKGMAASMSRYGRLLTAPFQRAITSIIKTGILSTTPSRTWSASREVSTLHATPKRSETTRNLKSTSTASGYYPSPQDDRGTGQTRAGHGSAKRAFVRGLLGQKSIYYASAVASRLSHLKQTLNIVQLSVRTAFVTVHHSGGLPWPVQNAAVGLFKRTEEQSTAPIAEPLPDLPPFSLHDPVNGATPSTLPNTVASDTAPPTVVGVASTNRTTKVFNLQVKNVSEYYANGILVHNCNAAQMAAVGSSLRGVALNKEQKIRMLMPKETLETLKTATLSGDRLSAALAYEFQREIAELTLDPNQDDFYDTLE